MQLLCSIHQERVIEKNSKKEELNVYLPEVAIWVAVLSEEVTGIHSVFSHPVFVCERK